MTRAPKTHSQWLEFTNIKQVKSSKDARKRRMSRNEVERTMLQHIDASDLDPVRAIIHDVEGGLAITELSGGLLTCYEVMKVAGRVKFLICGQMPSTGRSGSDPIDWSQLVPVDRIIPYERMIGSTAPDPETDDRDIIDD